MAENKKSFLLYCDLIHTVSKMPKEKAGELFMHILEYVNDKDPQTEDLIIQLTFEPIKQALKRDLKKYEKTLEEKSINGRIGNIKRWHIDLYDMIINETITLEEAENIAKYRKTSLSDKTNRNPSQTIAKIADIDNDSVSDSVIVNDKVIVIKDINARKREFYNSLIPFLDIYSKDMLKDFFEYWGEHGEKDKKFRKEKEKSFNLELRLKTWFKRSKEFKEKNVAPKKEKTLMLTDKMKQDYGIE